MNFHDVIKRGGKGGAQGMSSPTENEPVMQQAMPQAPAESPPRAAGPGFALPDLDPNDPDFDEKTKVHEAYNALEEHFSRTVPDVDFQGQYNKIMAGQKEPQERQMNPFSKFAIAFGTQDRENPYAPNVGLAGIKATEERRLGAEMSEFEKTLGMQKEAMTGQIKQHMAAGEFRKALAMAKTKADLDITADRTKGDREHKYKIAEIEAASTGKKEVARINAQAAIDRAERRVENAKTSTSNLKLSPTDKARMNQELERAMILFRSSVARDPNTGLRPESEEIEDAEDRHRRELSRIHEFWEDREIGDRPPAAGARADDKKTVRPSGAAWQEAAGQL